MKANEFLLLALLVLIFNGSKAQTTIDSLWGQAGRLEEAGKWAAAAQKYQEMWIRMTDTSSEVAARCQHNWGRCFLNEGNAQLGRHHTKRALDLRGRLYGELSEDYITSLNNYAQSFTFGEGKDLFKAITYQRQVMGLCARLEQPHPKFGQYSLNMGRMYYLVGDTLNAVNYWEQALPSVEKYSEMYEFLLEQLGGIYLDRQDMQNVERIMALVEDHNRHELTKECADVKCLLKRGEYFASNGNKMEADKHYMKAIEMSQSHKDRIDANTKYGWYKAMVEKNYIEGAEYQISAARVIADTLGRQCEEYAMSIYKAGTYYFLGTGYAQSLDCYLQAADFYQTESTDVAKENLSKLEKSIGNSYAGMRDFPNAIRYRRRVVNYYEQTGKTDDKAYPDAVEQLATAQKFNQDYDSSIFNYNKAIAVYKKQGNVTGYTNALTGLKFCYHYARRDDEFLALMENESSDPVLKEYETKELKETAERIKFWKGNLNIDKKHMGAMAYAVDLDNIANSYVILEDYDSSVAYYEKYMPALRDGIRETFRYRNASERMILWNERVSSVHDIYELLVTLPQGHEELFSRLAAVAYDAVLLSKGILLNSSISLVTLLHEKADKELLSQYEQSLANQKEIDRLRKDARSDEDFERILSLVKQNKTLEANLYNKCAEWADFTNYISYDWRDVQRALQPSDVAVEFVMMNQNYPFLDKDDFMAALILTSDMEYPMVLPICSRHDAMLIEKSDQVFDIDGNLVWGMMSNLLAGKRRIFFSADASFNNVAIEYLRYDGKPLSEQFEVYRLSSTKVICGKHVKPAYNKVALLGNINYFESGVKKTDMDTTVVAVWRHGVDSLMFSDLPFTKEEIDGIRMVFKSQEGYLPVIFEDDTASKSLFKSLSGTSVNILHIASHGAFFKQDRQSEEQAMKNSILALAGANISRDNGVITAAEIAEMNLRECHLAVLSACETALGASGSDGVFGLQRGFKNAGVGTLLMSLKSVHDRATASLMISFYTHLIKGETPRSALTKAQQDVRNAGYKESKYWTPFILLDDCGFSDFK